jgi:hypothetical protein
MIPETAGQEVFVALPLPSPEVTATPSSINDVVRRSRLDPTF